MAVARVSVKSACIVGFVVAALQCGCGAKESRTGMTPAFRSEVARLQERTSPVTSNARVTFLPRAYDGSTEAQWDILTGMEWPEYSRWVRQRLVPEFSVDTTNTRVLTCKKPLEADILVLSLAPDSVRNGLVHVRFRGSPW